MVGGIITGIQHLSDRVRLVVNGEGCDSSKEVVREVYPVGVAKMLRVGDSIWWQSMVCYWNGGLKKQDFPLVMIRQNVGDDKPWPYERAARMAGVA